MDSVRRILAREDSAPSAQTINILIALLALVFAGLVLAAVLVLLRRFRRRQQMRGELLPSYHEIKQSGSNNPRRLTISTSAANDRGRTSVIVFGRDGQPMLANPTSPPHSPDNVPEIHITFPDEQDDQGRHKSGRVVVVRVGDGASSIGLEPLADDDLPAYEKEGKAGQFYAIDMEKIGGLKEKERYPM